MPQDVKSPGASAPKPQKPGRPGQSRAPAQPAPTGPAVYEQTSRMHKVMAAVKGDDEFSVFSVSPRGRQKDPGECNPGARPGAQVEGGGKLLRFFKGFFGG